MILESKFNLKDDVFIIDENKIQKVKIVKISVTIQSGLSGGPYINYTGTRFNSLGDEVKHEFEEEKGFKTKEELIETL